MILATTVVASTHPAMRNVLRNLLPPAAGLDEQDATQHAVILLVNELDQATTREDQDEIIQRLRDTALVATQQT